MRGYIIDGGRPLKGELKISGAKNAALPLLSACLLTGEETLIHNCPRIEDVFSMQSILESLGAKVQFSGNTVCVRADQLTTTEMPRLLSKKIRSSIFLLGSVLGRERRAQFHYPGGCEIGRRPVDQHLCALRRLGVDILEQDDDIICRADRLVGAHIRLPYPSVGATENAILAAVLAAGETVIEGAAREPEIEDLQKLLVAMGGKVAGAGTDTIVIEGVERLHGAEHTCMPDRIEAGTFLTAAAAGRGDLMLTGLCPAHIGTVSEILRQAGARIEMGEDFAHIQMSGRPRAFAVTTLPYPGFPTDMQAQMCSVAAVAQGISRVTETVFESRMKHAVELKKAGAEIAFYGKSAFISGVERLAPADYISADLRGGAALTIAALSAEGRSTVGRVDLIERGYENFDGKLASVGAKICRSEDARSSFPLQSIIV